MFVYNLTKDPKIKRTILDIYTGKARIFSAVDVDNSQIVIVGKTDNGEIFYKREVPFQFMENGGIIEINEHTKIDTSLPSTGEQTKADIRPDRREQEKVTDRCIGDIKKYVSPERKIQNKRTIINKKSGQYYKIFKIEPIFEDQEGDTQITHL